MAASGRSLRGDSSGDFSLRHVVTRLKNATVSNNQSKTEQNFSGNQVSVESWLGTVLMKARRIDSSIMNDLMLLVSVPLPCANVAADITTGRSAGWLLFQAHTLLLTMGYNCTLQYGPNTR